MKYKKLFLLLPLLASFSCGGNNELKTKCPLGAPSLVFYDQGNNENFTTIADTAQILLEFQRSEYDALVVDATNGLNKIEQYSDSTYRFAKLLTSGNLYLCSYKFDVTTTLPTASDSLLSFGLPNSIPWMVSEKLKTPKFNNCPITYDDNVTNVLKDARYDLEKAEPTYAYYIFAEPALHSFISFAKEKEKTVTYKKLTDPSLFNNVIPQAALFINKNSYNNKKDKMTSYITNLNNRINNCINNPDVIKDELNKYGDNTTVSQRFGFTSEVAYNVQKDNNGFAIYPNSPKFDVTLMNKFMENVGSSTRYKEEDFINVE